MRCTPWALLVFLLPSVASAGSALDKPAFTATPAELLAEAKKAPPTESGAVILREDREVTLDAHGLATEHEHFIVAITSADAFEDWQSMYRRWRTWDQDRPVMRARVIAPGGQATDVDASKVRDQADQVGEGKYATLELPPLTPGSVIEEELTIAEHAPFPGGATTRYTIGSSWPASSTRVMFSAPVALKAHVVERALPAGVKPRHAVAGGRETWTYTIGALTPPDFETSIPEGVHTYPELSITAAASWASVARAYAAAVEPKLAITSPPDLPHGDTVETARAIKAWLHRTVRFTDGDLSSAPYDSVDLAAVIKRGTANTNESGALLVALLRNAGIHADLVLVDRGPQHGVDPDLPWLTAFDHVLVRARIAGAETWLDPEDPYAPLGQLREQDQGRFALSIADGALIHTPRAPATANVVHVVRTYELSEVEFARVTEVSTRSGVFDSDRRRWLAETSAAAVKKTLTSRTDSYLRGTLDSYTTTAVDDLSKPVEITTTVSNSGRAQTHWDRIDVFLFPSDTFDELPWQLRGAKQPERKLDLAISAPRVYEIESRIVVPAGYTIPDPARERTRDIGAAHLTETQRLAGQTLIVTFRLVLDKTRLTPAEVNETRRAEADVRNEKVHLAFADNAWTLVDRGKFRPGLAEMARRIAAHPSEAIHHEQLAQLLLKMGDGEAARREAHKAVELEPKSVDAYTVLGYVLTHDLVGRRWTPGHDHAGAKAALTKARALDPKYFGAAFELASLLERDDRGRAFEAGADLRGAAEQWRAVNDLDPSADHALTLVRALIWAGDGAGAEKVAQAQPASERRDALLTAAIALNRGADAAIRDVPGSDHDKTLQQAAAFMMMLRQYDAMRTIFAAAGTLPGAPPDVTNRVRRFDTAFSPTADPKDLMTELVLEEIDSARPIRIAWDTDTAKEVGAEVHKVDFPRYGVMTNAVAGDIVRSLTTTTVEGDASAWRITLDFMGRKEVIYAASDRGVPKMIGIPMALGGVGRHVLRLLAKHSNDAALRLLDWAVKDAPRSDAAALWGPSLPRDENAMTLAAASLTDDPKRMVELGTKCGATTQEGQFVCDMMAARGYIRRKMWPELDAFASSWASRVPKQAAAWPPYFRASALLFEARAQDAQQVLDDALAKNPDDPELRWLRGAVAARLGGMQDVASQASDSVQAHPTDVHVLNNAAWLELAYGVDLPGALSFAQRAVQSDPKQGYVMNTLAAIEAETGDLRAAMTDIQKAIDLSHEDAPPPGDWYVIGRIREQAGLTDDAIAAYKRAASTRDPEPVPGTSELATARLKALGAKK